VDGSDNIGNEQVSLLEAVQSNGEHLTPLSPGPPNNIVNPVLFWAFKLVYL